MTTTDECSKTSTAVDGSNDDDSSLEAADFESDTTTVRFTFSRLAYALFRGQQLSWVYFAIYALFNLGRPYLRKKGRSIGDGQGFCGKGYWNSKGRPDLQGMDRIVPHNDVGAAADIYRLWALL